MPTPLKRMVNYLINLYILCIAFRFFVNYLYVFGFVYLHFLVNNVYNVIMLYLFILLYNLLIKITALLFPESP